MESIKRRHMADLPLAIRLIAYLLILIGYFMYCYNFVVIDYVKPFLVQYYGISLEKNSFFYTFQSIGAIIGAFGCAWLASILGKKKTLIGITILNGLATIVSMVHVSFPVWCLMRFIIGVSLGGYYTMAISSMVGLFSSKVRGIVTAVAYSMFSIAIIFMGIYGVYLKEAGWEYLLWFGGIPPVIVGILMIFIVPDEEKYQPYGNEQDFTEESTASAEKGRWSEMFSSSFRKITLLCLLMAGLNLIGYQFFSGFVTVYLLDVRMFDAATMGALMSLGGLGNLAGAYVWGFISDRFGRKVNAFGFILSALMVALYFIVPSNVKLLAALGFFYNFGLACTSIWGGYFTELFPIRLRSMGASLFHGGRILALMSPYIVVMIKNKTDLTTAMWGAPIIFIIVSVIWLMQPETNKKGIFYKGYNPNK